MSWEPIPELSSSGPEPRVTIAGMAAGFRFPQHLTAIIFLNLE
jgi:hypothetical protein